ncbi:MAG: 30S ribosomal protein S2 [Desulfobulbaceae bacterium]|nr:30S ribosomal protein S2 [Desulfobulbaceae bacterium]
MSNVTMKEMLEAGLHFGHQTHRWNPKMKPFIFGARNKIYIINLDKTLPLFNKAYQFLTDTAAKGGTILFVGTKRQAQDIIREEAERCGMYFINHRWLGGMLTNYQTIKQSVDRLKSYEAMKEDGTINRYKKKEVLTIEKELIKLERTLGGIKNMRSLPAAIFVVDPKREQIAIKEANSLGIPVVGLADTNCDPDGITHVIPGNDDAIKSIRLIAGKFADAVLAGKERMTVTKQAEGDKNAAPEMMAAEAAMKAGDTAPAAE